MNSNTNGNDLSKYLQGVVIGGLLEKKVAANFNELPSPEFQEQALDIFSDNEQVAKLIVRHLLNQASGKVIIDAVPQPSAPPSVSPPVQQPTTLAEHLSLPKGGKAATIMHKLERFGSWDLLFTLEDWLAVNVPPYRWVRQGFSLACSVFSIEKVFAALLSLTVLYGGYRLVGMSVRLARNHFEKGTASETLKKETSSSILPTGQAGLLPPSSGVPVPQLTKYRYVSGHKLELRWNSVGEGYQYRFLFGSQTPNYPLMNGQTVNTTGAVINIAGSGEPQTYVAVIAVSPQGEESEPSQPVRFDLKPWNKDYSLEPLAFVPAPEVNPPQAVQPKPVHKIIKQAAAPIDKNVSINKYVPRITSQQPAPQSSFLSSFTKRLVGNADGVVSSIVPIAPLAQGINATKNAALQASADVPQSSPQATVPIPMGLEAEKVSNATVRLSWDSVGPGYRYNYYSGFVGDPKSFEIENLAPLAVTANNWSPYDRSKAYMVVVTSVDKEGHESARSAPVLVDLR